MRGLSAVPWSMRLPSLGPFGSQSENPVMPSSSIVQDPISLPCNIVQREIAPVPVLSDHAFTSSEEATEAIHALSKAALHLGMMNVLSELELAGLLWKTH